MADRLASPIFSRKFWLWRLVLGFAAPKACFLALDHFLRLPGGEVQRLIEMRLIMAAVDAVLLVAIVRSMEGRTMAQSRLFDPAGWKQRFGWGLLLGAGPVLFQAGAMAAAGIYSFSPGGNASIGEAAALAVVLFIAGADEEVRYRALLLRPINDGLGSVMAMVLSGVVFGLFHAGNRGATPAGVAVIAAGGVMLAAAYLRTGSLWLTIGFHWAWNLTMGVVLGLPVSGIQIPSLLKARMEGPVLWSGGAFGPEASALTAGLVVIATVLIVRSAVIARSLTSPAWIPAAWRRLTGRAAATAHIP